MKPDAESEALQRFIEIQTRGRKDLSSDEMQALLKRRRIRFFVMIGINVMAVLFFGYSYQQGITSLPGWVIASVAVVFLLNMGVIVRQLQWLEKALAYLARK
jgi:small-conductance mechanosensitive channel